VGPDWRIALENVVARTGHEHFRVLTADNHPDREIWRRRMIEKDGGDPGPLPSPPVPPLAKLLARKGGCCGGGVADIYAQDL
jgi:hypothetical protein